MVWTLFLFLHLFVTVMMVYGKICLSQPEDVIPKAGSMEDSSPHLEEFSFAVIKAATKDFSSENKLGEGGYGPVYKVNFDPLEIFLMGETFLHMEVSLSIVKLPSL